MNENRQPLKSTKRRKKNYYRHAVRKDSCLEDIIQGYVHERRSAMKYTRMTEGITEWTKITIYKAVQISEGRHQCHNVLR